MRKRCTAKHAKPPTRWKPIKANVAQLLHQQHVQHGGTAPDALRLLLSGENPNEIARELHYLSYLSRARGDAIRGMRESLAN